MNYYKKILTYLIPIWILVSINFSQDLSIDLTLLNTGQFTLNNWNNVAELWQLEIENTSTVKIDYYLKFILKKNDEDIVEGHTKPLSINSYENITYGNLDPVFDQSILAYYYEASDFTSNIINQLGYLPPGNYTLELIAFDLEDNKFSSDEEEIEFTLGEQFSIDLPDDGIGIGGESELVFEWSSPGFREGVQIEFRLIIAAITEVLEAEDAIEYGSNSVFYFDSDWADLNIINASEWPYIEHGNTQSLYPITLDHLNRFQNRL